MADQLTQAVSTAGATISLGDGASPEGFDPIDEVVTIGGPNPDSEELDATHLTSPGRTREYIQSFLTPGECPITVNFAPTKYLSHQRLMSLYESGDTVSVRITYPDGGSTDDFKAYVKNRPTSLNVGEVWRTQFTFRVTGLITFTAGAGSPA